MQRLPSAVCRSGALVAASPAEEALVLVAAERRQIHAMGAPNSRVH